MFSLSFLFRTWYGYLIIKFQVQAQSPQLSLLAQLLHASPLRLDRRQLIRIRPLHVLSVTSSDDPWFVLLSASQ